MKKLIKLMIVIAFIALHCRTGYAYSTCGTRTSDADPLGDTCTIVWTGDGYGMIWRSNPERYPYPGCDLYFTLLDSEGVEILAQDIQVTLDPATESRRPRLVWADGEYATAWVDKRDGNDQIYFARLDVGGNKIGNDVRVTNTTHAAQYPSIVWTGTEYGIAWCDWRHSGAVEVYFARYDSLGNRIGDEVRVTNAPGHKEFLSLVWTGTEFGMVWDDERHDIGAFASYSRNLELYFARLDHEGHVIDSPSRITNMSGWSQRPEMVWNGNGYGIAWLDYRDGVRELYLMNLDSQGTKVGDDIRLTYSPVYVGRWSKLSLEWNGHEYGVAWSYDDLYFTTIDLVGRRTGPEIRLGCDRPAGGPSLEWTGTEWALGYMWNHMLFYVNPLDCVGHCPEHDADADGIPNADDNCVEVPNPEQIDTDLDGLGDACDLDDDDDGILDAADNCPYTVNPGQEDLDSDGYGDPCDADPDGDGIFDPEDNCALTPNPYQTDTDTDGLGDACDPDDDNDGICDTDVVAEGICIAGPDNCSILANPGQEDLDGDGIGDACDADLDGDGTDNSSDNCPVDPNPAQDDTDFDGEGDACDEDDDNDGVLDQDDNCALVANPDQLDADLDGLGDICDDDLDGDGVDNTIDNCPETPNSSQLDQDGDGLGDACDPDMDNDGVLNETDLCAATMPGDVVDPANGCSVMQLCPCEGRRGTTIPWKNHGKYVSCIAHAAEDFLDLGLIAETEKDALVSDAAQSECGK